MKAIYFPFTHMEEPVFSAMTACFLPVILYRSGTAGAPLSLEENTGEGILQVVEVDDPEDHRPQGATGEFPQWMDRYRKGERAFLKSRQGTVPFYEDTSPFRIRSELKERLGTSDSRERGEMAAEARARLFLKAAQSYDRENREFQRGVASFHKSEQTLIQHLTGKVQRPDVRLRRSLGFREDPGEYMTGERIRAWARVAQKDMLQNGSDGGNDILATSSRAVLDYIREMVPGLEMLASVKSLPVRGESHPDKQAVCREIISQAMAAAPDDLPVVRPFSVPVPGERTFSMEIFRVQGESPCEFLNRFTRDSADERAHFSQGTFTLICRIEI